MMKTWFPKGMPVLSGDELAQARELKKAECRLSIHDATQVSLDQCGESLPIAEAAWTGEITFAFEGERRQRSLCNALDEMPRPADVLKHIEISGTELNRWIQEKHSWVVFRFPEKGGQTLEPEANAVEPVQRSAAQDTAILNQIKTLGLDPQSIPKNEPGKGGVKAQVRSALVGVSPLFPKVGTQFDHAWDRLRARKEVADHA
jgi:hypothetical protein